MFNQGLTTEEIEMLQALLEGMLFEVLQVSIFEAGFVAALVTAAGMLSILYALYAPNP